MSATGAASTMHLAELNFGTLRYGWDDPRTKPFLDALDMVNAVAERADGFVWRMTDDDMQTAQNDPADVFGGNPNVAATLSVWRDFGALQHFVFNTIHGRFLARRHEWFDALDSRTMVLWPVPVGHTPTLREGNARLQQLQTEGPSEQAFDWAYAETRA